MITTKQAHKYLDFISSKSKGNQEIANAIFQLRSFINQVEQLDEKGLDDAICNLSQIGEWSGGEDEWTYDTEKNYPEEFECLNKLLSDITEMKEEE